MASVDEVYTVVKDTQVKVNDLVEWKAGMTEACKGHRKETDDIKDTLYSNPGGLRGKVEKMWEWRGIWIYVLKVVAAAGAVGFIAWVLNSIFGSGG